MSLLKIQSAESVPQKPTLPDAEVSATYDEATNSIVVNARFPLSYDEAAIVSRLGKKDKETGEQSVTSRTYGIARNIPTGMADGENNMIKFTAKLFAPVAGAEGDDSETEES
jgi:hypothetical protein